MAKLIGIATHRESKGAIHEHQRIAVSLNAGLQDDYQGGRQPLHQVTLLSLSSWQAACNEVGVNLPWTQRRANLLVDEMDFDASMMGMQIQVGQVLLEIVCETDPCSRMEALHPGLKQALAPDWRGGARCKVLRGGEIQLGDHIHLLKRV